MLNSSYFYHRSIRKLVVAFGSIFNDIEIVRFTDTGKLKERFKVILSYGHKEKYIRRINSDPDLNKSIATIVPRIAFTLEDIRYDISRKQISSTLSFYPSSTSTTGVASQYAPVPYNFDFTVSIYARNIEDGSQILEQILPFFTPDYTLPVKFIDALDRYYDVPVILNDVRQNFDYDGEFENLRLLIWDLTFTAKSFIWPIMRDNTPIIKSANTNFFTNDICTVIREDIPPIATLVVIPDPIDAGIDDNYGFSEHIYYYPENT